MIFLISANPLFREIIRESLAQFKEQCLELEPARAMALVCEVQPEIIILDESLDLATFEGLLREARQLEHTRVLVVSPQKDEMILLDSRRTRLRKIEDILEAI